MTTVRDFIIECLDDEARLLAHTAEFWEREQPNRQFEFPLSNFISRYGPEATTRHLGSARDVVRRHRLPDEGERRRYWGSDGACAGCGVSGYTDALQWVVDDINDCPELRTLAWRWNHHRKWEKRWCLHMTIENVNATSHDERARGVYAYVKVCRRCGEQFGDVHTERLITVRRQP